MLVTLLPSGSTVMTSDDCGVLNTRANAIAEPSGDHIGSRSFASGLFVNCCLLSPVADITQSCEPVGVWTV